MPQRMVMRGFLREEVSMSNEMKVQSFDTLLNWILDELKSSDSIFGIHKSLFWNPASAPDVGITDLYGQYLASPVGPAAGPHTQLAQNIVAAWLSGGRFIELKTVQIMDELEIPRPCIDMEDEGYNVEWSQELKLDQSVREYIHAWVLIHILRRVLDRESTPFGTIFNMSVGYDLKGIQSKPMTRFMDRLADASVEINEIHTWLSEHHPEFADIEIPDRITNNVTLSTMHGCPPDEIEKIAKYLIEERKLHTTIKLNPTLLGKEKLLSILHDSLGYTDIQIPDSVFDNDLKYDRALQMIRSLQSSAETSGVSLRIKLSNTLAMANHRDCLPGDEMYMSGRSLFPITINLLTTLLHEFEGSLDISYSAGADALNAADLIAGGIYPVTVATDILKPGGYSRFLQYIENIQADLTDRELTSIEEILPGRLEHLDRLAAKSLKTARYKKAYFAHGLPKVECDLKMFDCIEAPCMAKCAVHQDIPEYIRQIELGNVDRALEIILARNPLPGITGYVCTNLCQTRCARNNSDEPVAIRMLKRYAQEHGSVTMKPNRETVHLVAIIGSGPAGLAAACFLGLNGVKTTIFEARDTPGGMCAIAPAFRLPRDVVQADIDRITGLGAEIELNHKVTAAPETLLDEGYDAVYVGVGFPGDATLDIPGIEADGVMGALTFLEQAARGDADNIGSRVLVIGGGNTAMDAARTACRLTSKPSTVIYRRTRHEMPAEPEEIQGFLEEGIFMDRRNILEELVSPKEVVVEDGRLVGLICIRNRLGEPGADGRRRPEPVPDSEFRIDADTLILAIGQMPDNTIFTGSGVIRGENGAVKTNPGSGETDLNCIYAGGDVVRGPAMIIEACADGLTAAQSICRDLGIDFKTFTEPEPTLTDADIPALKKIRARKSESQQAPMLPPLLRTGFDLVEQTLDEHAARTEAARCFQCTTVCDKCVSVCPNRANISYRINPLDLTLPTLICENDELVLGVVEQISIKQTRQVLHLDDFCNECGNCATFCVHQGKPYRDKPRLFLNRDEFNQESDNAFFIDGATILRRENGYETRLTLNGGPMRYESNSFTVELSPEFQVSNLALKTPFSGPESLAPAVEMALLYRGIKESLPYIPSAE